MKALFYVLLAASCVILVLAIGHAMTASDGVVKHDGGPAAMALPSATPSPMPSAREYIGTYTIYAYCPCRKCCGKSNGITASGVTATEGRTVAADLPFGTRIYIDGIGERIVEDRGVSGKEIDLFMDSHNRALEFGVRKAKVYIER